MKKIFFVILLLVFASVIYAQKPSNWSDATAASVKARIGLDTLKIVVDGKVDKDSLVDPVPLIYSTVAVIPTTSVTDDYTLILTDAGKFVSMTAATDKTITIPLFATVAYAVNTVIYFENLGTADLIIAITATGTLTSESSYVKIPAKCTAFVKKSATNTWNLAGRLKA